MNKVITVSDDDGSELTGKVYVHLAGDLTLVRADGSTFLIALAGSDYTQSQLAQKIKAAV